MARTRVLITVTTYPQPSHSYGELVCTAGVLEDGSWVRIYPVPFEFLARAEGDEEIAITKVRQRYEMEFMANKEITFFLGTTLLHHLKRHTNPFTIIGVFYPPRVNQQDFFD